MSVLAHLSPLERRLVAAGFPAMSPWWLATVTRFYESGRRQLVLRVGRRGGKSSTLCRVAVLEALYGEHRVPPGDVGVVAIVSVSRDEASQRLRTIKAILDVLGVRYRPIEGGIELESRPVAFKVFSATVAGVSGFTAVCAVCDEAAKWRDSDTGANPATEVLGSLRPTMATMPGAKMFLSSSPLGPNDAHAEAFGEGDGDFQVAAYAPTWTANPSVSEADTRRLEPDDRKWRREYLAEPQQAALAAFDSVLVDRAMRTSVPGDWTVCGRVMLVDPTAGSSDTFAFAVCGWRKQLGGEQSILELLDVGGVADAAAAGVTSDRMVAEIARVARSRGIRVIHSDQFERFSLASAFARVGFTFTPHTWTSPLKERATEHVRGWLRDGMLALPKHDKLRSELLSFEERISPSGALTFRGRGNTHDDYAMLLLLAAAVDIESGLKGSPTGAPLPGAGWVDYMAQEAAIAAGGGPSQPLVVPAEPELISLALPPKFAGTSTYYTMSGTMHSVEAGGRIRIAADHQDLDMMISKQGFVRTS